MAGKTKPRKAFNALAAPSPQSQAGGWVRLSALTGLSTLRKNPSLADVWVRKPLELSAACARTQPDKADCLDTFRTAVFALSQSNSAREILAVLKDKNYKILIDDKRLPGDKNYGEVDFERREILLKGCGQSAAGMALTLLHEARHVQQHEVFGVNYDGGVTPKTALALELAAEADARAMEIQTSLELLCGHNRQGPQPQMALPMLWQVFGIRNPVMAIAVASILPQSPKAIEKVIANGRAAQQAFEAFYDDTKLRAIYEDRVVRWFSNFSAAEIRKPENFSREADLCSLPKSFLLGGASYIASAGSYGLDNSRYCGFREDSATIIEGFFSGRSRMPSLPRSVEKRQKDSRNRSI